MLRRLFLSACLFIHCVSAGIYVTYPIGDTVLSAGRLATVQWTNDRGKPSVTEMGPVKIDLYVGESYVTTLAEQVDPASRSMNVWISPSLRHNGSDYHMRFICEDPSVTVYTADFTITDMANIYPLDGLAIDEDNTSTPTVTYITPALTLVLPDETIVSTLKPTPVTLRPSATAPPLSTEDQDDWPIGVQAGAAVATLGKRPTLDMELFKFRIVFIFWPALVGMTMAM